MKGWLNKQIMIRREKKKTRWIVGMFVVIWGDGVDVCGGVCNGVLIAPGGVYAGVCSSVYGGEE